MIVYKTIQSDSAYTFEAPDKETAILVLHLLGLFVAAEAKNDAAGENSFYVLFYSSELHKEMFQRSTENAIRALSDPIKESFKSFVYGDFERRKKLSETDPVSTESGLSLNGTDDVRNRIENALKTLSAPQNKEVHVDIYTHGSCPQNHGVGAWASLLKSGRHEKLITGLLRDTTGHQSEMYGILNGLLALKYPSDVTVYTRNLVLVKKFSGQRCGLDKDLYNDIRNACEPHTVHFQWVDKDTEIREMQMCINASRAAANQALADYLNEQTQCF